MNSKLKTFLILGLFVALTGAVVFFLSGGDSPVGWSNLAVAILFSVIFGAISYFFSAQIILGISGAKEISPNADPKFHEVVEHLAKMAGLPKPKIYSISDPAINAFATGRDPQHATVCVTTGLRESLTLAEIEGVLGHELSHVSHFDTLLMSVVGVLVGILTIVADWFMRSLWWQDSSTKKTKSESYFVLIGVILAIFSPIAATLIQLFISRQREFEADAGSAKITGDPEGLAQALEKISRDDQIGHFANNATAHLFIVNPFKGRGITGWLSGLFDTHPPIEERILALRRM